jgi:hypothetical protein
MPIDKRKMTNTIDQHTWLPSKCFSSNTIYFLLIFFSLVWNAYNTYQYQILTERQLKLENILKEILPTSSSLSSLNKIQASSSSIEQWFTKALHFIQQLTSKDTTNNNNSNTIVQSYTVRFVFLEMLIESLDTCISVYTYGSCQGHSWLFQTCITNLTRR